MDMRSLLKKIDAFGHRFFALGDDPLAGDSLRGDRQVEFAFVLKNLPRDTDQTTLDIGACESPLTTMLAASGFGSVDAVDLMPSPVDFSAYPNLRYFQGNFLESETISGLRSQYDVVSLCSTIEHFGLKRYGSPEIPGADIDCLKNVEKIISPKGTLILTIPYGQEKTIAPFHRVYNETGPMLQYLFQKFEPVVKEYYKKNGQHIWVQTTEAQAAVVNPEATTYALGLFVLRPRISRG